MLYLLYSRNHYVIFAAEEKCLCYTCYTVEMFMLYLLHRRNVYAILAVQAKSLCYTCYVVEHFHYTTYLLFREEKSTTGKMFLSYYLCGRTSPLYLLLRRNIFIIPYSTVLAMQQT
jgi:hypothetical protein